MIVMGIMMINHMIIMPMYGKTVSDEENSDSSEGSTGSYLRTKSWSWGVALDAEIIVNYQKNYNFNIETMTSKSETWIKVLCHHLAIAKKKMKN